MSYSVKCAISVSNQVTMGNLVYLKVAISPTAKSVYQSLLMNKTHSVCYVHLAIT